MYDKENLPVNCPLVAHAVTHVFGQIYCRERPGKATVACSGALLSPNMDAMMQMMGGMMHMMGGMRNHQT